MSGLTANILVWPSWNHDATTSVFLQNPQTLHSNTGATSTIWTTWAGTYYVHPSVLTPAAQTAAAQRAAQRAAEIPQMREADRQDKIKRELADEKAEIILQRALTPAQRKDWVAEKRFTLHVGDKCYRISRGRSGNVELIHTDGTVLQRYCCHVKELVPIADNALAQLLMLQHNEQAFLGLANVHYTAPGFRRAA